MKVTRMMGALAAIAISASAMAQGTITHGNATYTNGTGNTGAADWLANGAGITDQFTTNQWAFRLGGAVGQMRLSMGTATATTTGGALGVTSQSYVGNVATLNWSHQGVNFGLNMTLLDGPGLEESDLLQTMTITNTTNEAVTIALFNYADIDVSRLLAANAIPGGSTAFNNDSAVIGGAGTIQTLTDGALGTQLTWSAPTADAWEIRAFSTLGSAIRSATTYNLANTGSPFGPGDYTGAFQWNLTIAAGASVTVASNFSIVPAPGALALLGLAGLVGGRRRRC